MQKPNERRALVLLAGCGAAGCTEAVMLLHGFTAEQLTKLVGAGFADTTIERRGWWCANARWPASLIFHTAR